MLNVAGRLGAGRRAGLSLGSWGSAGLAVWLLCAPLRAAEANPSPQPAPPSRAEATMAGPLFSHFPLTLAPGSRTEAFGPFWFQQERERESGWGFPPLFSYTEDAATDSEEWDLLYPVFTYDRFGEEWRGQLFQWLSFAGGDKSSATNVQRFTLFPFYFQQRSPNPAENYTALLPVYGRLRGRLFRDEINFVLLPLYVQTKKKDVVTDNYLLPFIHRRSGPDLSGWQVWPLVGHEEKVPSLRTNLLDQLEPVAGHEKFFALWPIYFNDKVGLGTTNVVHQHALLPLFSRQRSPARDTATYPWPLGLTLTEDRAKRYREIGLPWPLIVYAYGPGKTAYRLWPLFGHGHNAELRSDFVAWPLYTARSAKLETLHRKRAQILYYLYSDLTEENTVTKTALRRTDLWPLFTARRDHRGHERFQVLALLEPILPNNKSIERNYSPLWSLWRSEKNGTTGARSRSFLWNLYRSEETEASKKCSIFFGLFQYQSDARGRHWRLFFLPAKRSAPETAKP